MNTANSQAELCTYQTWDWDTIHKKSVNHRKVTKQRTELTVEELGTVQGCSVCSEDQSEIQIASLPPISVCHAMAHSTKKALTEAAQRGFSIETLVGYRVGRSKGPINSEGLRTQFSNHSYGVAIDINSEKNGLYHGCEQFGPQCRLIRGGEYHPNALGSITRLSVLYKCLRAIGLKWGGEMTGDQKDFMHFSHDGQ